MSILPSCWDSIVGLSRTIDPCVDDYPVGYNDSLSGLYLDEIDGIGLKPLDEAGNSTTVWEKMERARENAIRAFQTDLMRALSDYKEPRRGRFSGDIGGKSFTRLLTASTYYGMRMYSDIRGGKFNLRAVSLILNTSEAVNLEIYDEYDLLHTVALTSVAGRPHKTDFTDIELTLDRNYYFLISPVGVPYSNKLTCGCGGYKWCFSFDNPCYKPSRDRWTEWVMVAGVSGAVLADREDWPTNRMASGMILHGNFTCFDELCSEDSDFARDDLDRAKAYAIWYKSGEFLADYILDSGNVNRYTLLGGDVLNEKRVFYHNKYLEFLLWLAQNMEDTECLRCKPPMGMRKMSQRI